MKASTPNLWAPLVTPERGKPWINPNFVRRTRTTSKAAWVKVCGTIPANVRFVRVTVTEQ